MAQISTLSSTTETQGRLRVVGYPSDYDVHHSNPSPSFPSLENEPHDELPATSQQPSDVNSEAPEWPNHYRRIPAYRPIDHDLDQSQRRVYLNGAERAFIFVMFTGVGNLARLNKLWKMTGEKINDQVFGYKIGGEW